MKVIYRVQAVSRMFERGIAEAEVHKILSEGEQLAAYPDNTPYPSRLLLGWAGDRPLHVVAAYNAQNDEEIVITVYEPDSVLWDDGFRRRRQ